MMDMNKAGIVYEHIAEALLKNRKEHFTERGIAKLISVSPDTVNNAIAPLKRIGAVHVYRTYFQVHNFKKLLLFWAVNRKFGRDVIYSTHARVRDVSEIENHMPNEVAYTCFSGYVKRFRNDAADYSEVYVYAGSEALEEIKKRFPKEAKSQYDNLIVLKPDRILEDKIVGRKLDHSAVSLPRLYVDLWNNNTWYANDFLLKLEKRIDDIYAKAILE